MCKLNNKAEVTCLSETNQNERESWGRRENDFKRGFDCWLGLKQDFPPRRRRRLCQNEKIH